MNERQKQFLVEAFRQSNNGKDRFLFREVGKAVGFDPQESEDVFHQLVAAKMIVGGFGVDDSEFFVEGREEARRIIAEGKSSKPAEPDWSNPFFLNTPETKAILNFLRILTPHFTAIPKELTDAEWTAFRALTAVGAVEGILSMFFTHHNGEECQQYYHIRGDYITAMPKEEVIRNDAPVKLDVIEARLTGTGEQWAQYLKGEEKEPNKYRAFVMSLLWRSPKRAGTVTATMPRTTKQPPKIDTPVPTSSSQTLTEDAVKLLCAACAVAPIQQAVDYRSVGQSIGLDIQRADAAYGVLGEARYIRPLWVGHLAVTEEGAEFAARTTGKPSPSTPTNNSPPNSPPAKSLSFVDAAKMCGEAIRTFRVNRPLLANIYDELNLAAGGPWTPKCVRDGGAGALALTGQVVRGSVEGNFLAAGIITDRHPYAPIRDFKLIDSTGIPPVTDTPVFVIQQKMFYFMEEIRRSSLILSQLLPQFETVAPTCGIDPTALTQLRHRLPPFPYIPIRKQMLDFGNSLKVDTNEPPNFSASERKKAVAEDEPFLASALITLEHLVQAHWRDEQAMPGKETGMRESKDDSGTPADSGDQPPKPGPPRAIEKWVAAVVAVSSGAATVYGLFADKRIAVFAFVGMVFAILILVVVRRAIHAVSIDRANFYDGVAKVMVIFVVIYFMALACVLFPALVRWLTNENATAAKPNSTLAASGTPQTVAPFAVWKLALSGNSDRISKDVRWPYLQPRHIRFNIVNASDSNDGKSIQLCLKEVQDVVPDEVRSDTFSNGDVVNVNGPSRGGNYSYYVSPVSLPEGAEKFFAKYPDATVQAFDVPQ